VSVSLRFNAAPGSYTFTVNHNSILQYSPGGKPTQVVGVAAAPFIAPAVDAVVQISLNNPYTGPSPALVTIGSAQYILTAVAPAPPTNAVTLLNINDTAGNTVTAPATLVTIPQLPAGRMLTYGMGRVWDSLTDGISFLAGDIVGGSSGSPTYNYRDAVLNVTENDYLAGGGLFRVPGSTGAITGMLFTITIDAALGQGPLQVFTNRNVFSCQAPVDRTTWQSLTNPILTEALKGDGATGQNSLVNSNADIIFRSPDGKLRSLLLAALDFNQWGDTPISYEIQRIIANENDSLMSFCSAITFDNRMLMTCQPAQQNNGVVWGGIIALNFDNISSLQKKSNSSYDGLWQGLNILQLIKFNTVNRAFAFVLNPTNTIELWELLATGVEHFDNGATPIPWSFESPVVFNEVKGKGLFDLVRLVDGEIYIGDVEGTVNFCVEYRPDYSPCWYPWAKFYVCAATGEGLSNQYRTRIGLGEPCVQNVVEFNNQPSREGRFFQIRVSINGHCVFQGAKLGAVEIPESQFAPPLRNEPKPPYVCQKFQ